MNNTVARFEIHYSRVLNPPGEVIRPLPAFAQNPANLIPLYRAMMLTRTFDAKTVALQRTGRLGTYASSLGQEAVAVGVAAAMQPEDVLLPSFREHGAQLWRGVSLLELFLFWGGDERGNDFKIPRQDFPVCVPVGSHAPHAVGVALAFRLRHEARVAVCLFGDGTELFMKSFPLPDLGEGLQEAEIVTWHVNVGDHVVADQPLVAVETDKAVVEIPSPQAGHIARLCARPGDRIKG